MFYCIGSIQYIIYIVLSYPFSPDSLGFVDICTFANCSVLFLTGPQAGYYIHGKAPWEQSDLPLGWLKEELDKEAAGKLKARGFNVPESEQNRALAFPSTFEIYAHPWLRNKYEEIWNDTGAEQEMKKNQ